MTEHCQKFDDEEENKLEYTDIHKAYEAMVEGYVKEAIGEEKLHKIELGIPDYVKGKRKSKNSKEVMDAIEILSSLGDFVEFKKVMLEWKD